MQVILEIHSGTQAGKRVELRAPASLIVGRTGPEQLIIPDDTLLSNQHFTLEVTAEQCILRDLNSQFGTLVGGKPARERVLQDGEAITAGQTRFLVRIQVAAPTAVQTAAEPN